MAPPRRRAAGPPGARAAPRPARPRHEDREANEEILRLDAGVDERNVEAKGPAAHPPADRRRVEATEEDVGPEPPERHVLHVVLDGLDLERGADRPEKCGLDLDLRPADLAAVNEGQKLPRLNFVPEIYLDFVNPPSDQRVDARQAVSIQGDLAGHRRAAREIAATSGLDANPRNALFFFRHLQAYLSHPVSCRSA